MGLIKYQGHVLTWTEHSQGAETIVFINGYSGSQKSWGKEIALLQDTYRCVTLDLPGHYPAQAPPNYEKLTQDDLFEITCLATEQISMGQALTMIGHSTGGLAALGVAAKRPDLVRRMVCISPVVWGHLTGILGIALWFLERGIYPVFWMLWRYTQINVFTIMFGLAFYTHNTLAHWRNGITWEAGRQSKAYYQQQSLKNLAVLLMMLAESDARPIAQDITCPTLVITGEHDPVVPAEQAQWLADNLSQSELCMMSKTGHIAHFEEHDQWQTLLTDWLSRS